ncbi:MAG: DUF5663 domain-containing protein [Actinomycetota bacterium]|nr:DUF5663 domain-containing protein [Actinomycetota bacterium]
MVTPTNTISVLALQAFDPAGASVPNLEKRDWRLLSFLIWTAHCAATHGEEPPRLRRHALERPLGVQDQRAIRNALSNVRRMLRAAGSERALVIDNDTVAFEPSNGLACDLVEMLTASRCGDRAAVQRLVAESPFGRESIDLLAANLRPRGLAQRARADWIDELVDELRRNVEDPGRAAEITGHVQDVDFDDDTDAYLRAHIERCASIDPRQLPPGSATRDIDLPLEDVYISLMVGPRAASEVTADREVTRAQLEGAAQADSVPDGLLFFEGGTDRESIHFTDLIRTSRWSVILGHPGMGKTTLLQWLALFNARALFRRRKRVFVAGAQLGMEEPKVDLGPTRLPILVRIADYAELAEDGKGDSLPEFIEFLGRHPVMNAPLPLEPEAAARIIRRWLAAGRALILLDGLDEISDVSLRAAIVERVERFLRGHARDPILDAFEPWDTPDSDEWWGAELSEPATAGGNQVVVTSRVRGYKEAPLVASSFKLVQARPLELPAIRRFCRRWCLAVERVRAVSPDCASPGVGMDVRNLELTRRAAEQSKRLVEAVQSHHNIRRLAENPLLLTVLAVLQRESERLPRTRFEIYTEISRVLAERRDPEWAYDQIVDALGPFALWLHEHRDRGIARSSELRKHLAPGIERVTGGDINAEIEKFLEDAQQQSGLLVEAGADLYGFMHGTFREYFAAMELARKPEQFRRWLLDHRQSSRWVEVALLGVAALAKNMPDEIDGILELVLDQQPEHEPLLHHDLLFVGTCLTETVRASPALTARVVRELLDAGSSARERGFEQLNGRIVRAMRDLLARWPRLVRPVLVDSLTDTSVAPLATELLADAPAGTPGLLDGLDRACQEPDRSVMATAARARVATLLHRDGTELPPELVPIGTLFDGPYASTFAHIEIEAPAIADALRALGERVDPSVHRLVQWFLASVKNAPTALVAADLTGRLVVRALRDVGSARGSDFSALADLAFRLDPQRTRERITEGLVDRTIDPPSAARYLATQPEALAVEDLTVWLEQVHSDVVPALLRFHHPRIRESLVPLAWRTLRADAADGHWHHARQLLMTQAVTAGWLRAEPDAFETLELLFAREDPSAHRLAETLLSKVRLPRPEALARSNEALSHVERIAADPAHPCATAATLMLAEQPDRPLTPENYAELARALASEEVLRQRAMDALLTVRPAEKVGLDVLEQAQTCRAERLEAGDAGAADAHGGFSMKIEYTSAARVLDDIETQRGWGGSGILTPLAAEEVLACVPELGETEACAALEACRAAVRSGKLLGLDLDHLERLALTDLGGGVRGSAARLAAGETVFTARLDRLAPFLVRMREIDSTAAAQALCTAAHCLPLARTTSRRDAAAWLSAIASECLPMDEDPLGWQSAGARLAVDVLTPARPAEPLHLLAERTTTPEEIAKALIFALETDHDFPPGTHDQPIRPSAITHTARRVGLVAAEFATTPRGMAAVVPECHTHLARSDWPRRRACLLALDAAATASPAQFVAEAEGSDLRATVLSVAADPWSFSVRRLAISVLSHLRILDQQALELIAAACRDKSIVGGATIMRCRTFDSPSELDLSQLVALLDSRNAHAVEAGATLLANMARTARSTHAGQAQHEVAVSTLASVASSPDPLLDCSRTSGGRTLRQDVHSRLTDLVWTSPSRPAPDSELGRTATQLSWATPELDRAMPARTRASSEALTASLIDALQALASQDPKSKPKPKFQLRDARFDWDELGLGVLRAGQDHLLSLAVLEVLEIRVGIEIAGSLTPAQLDEFEAHFENNDDAAAFRWLENNRPDYRDVVNSEAVALEEEIRGKAAELKQLLDQLIEEHGRWGTAPNG